MEMVEEAKRVFYSSNEANEEGNNSIYSSVSRVSSEIPSRVLGESSENPQVSTGDIIPH